MALTRLERERINDSRLKIQSISESLSQIDPRKIPEFEEIQACLQQADHNLGGALSTSPQAKP